MSCRQLIAWKWMEIVRPGRAGRVCSPRSPAAMPPSAARAARVQAGRARRERTLLQTSHASRPRGAATYHHPARGRAAPGLRPEVALINKAGIRLGGAGRVKPRRVGKLSPCSLAGPAGPQAASMDSGWGGAVHPTAASPRASRPLPMACPPNRCRVDKYMCHARSASAGWPRSASVGLGSGPGALPERGKNTPLAQLKCRAGLLGCEQAGPEPDRGCCVAKEAASLQNSDKMS